MARGADPSHFVAPDRILAQLDFVKLSACPFEVDPRSGDVARDRAECASRPLPVARADLHEARARLSPALGPGARRGRSAAPGRRSGRWRDRVAPAALGWSRSVSTGSCPRSRPWVVDRYRSCRSARLRRFCLVARRSGPDPERCERGWLRGTDSARARALTDPGLLCRVEGRRVTGRVRWLIRRFRTGPQSETRRHVSSPRSPVGSRTGAPPVGSGGCSVAFAPGLSPAPVGTFPAPASSNPACRFTAPYVFDNIMQSIFQLAARQQTSGSGKACHRAGD